MKTILVKMIAMLLLAVMVVSFISTNVFADDFQNYMESIENSGGSSGDADKSIAKIIAGILKVARLIGVGVAVIMLIVLAIKYISASPGDKAEIKKHATVYVVGAFVLFGASGILEIIRKFVVDNMENSAEVAE